MRHHLRFPALAMLCALAIGGFAGCSALNSLLGGALGEASLTIGEPTVAGLVVGSTRTVTITAKDKSGAVESFSATSNDLNVVTVTRAKTSVTLRGVSPGTTTVDILSASGKTDYIDVQVIAGPPTVTAILPADGATDIPINSKITATFSAAMLSASITSSSFSIVSSTGTNVSGSVSYDVATRTATFTPSSNLVNNMTYIATIQAAVMDLAGTAMTSPKIWTFSTAAVSASPPSIVSVSPADGATGVASNSQINVAFSIAMNQTTIGVTSFSVASLAGTAVAGSVSYDTTSRIATFIPSTALAASTMYIVSIANSITSLEGVALTAPYTFAFTTAALAVGAPTVLTVSPANGASSVPVNATITAVFSTAMDPSTITSSSFSVAGATGFVTYDAITMTATFTPSNNLGYATTYAVTISTLVKNTSGVSLAMAKTWNFTTESEPLVPPTVTSVSPANAAVGVSTTATVSAVFSTAMDAGSITAATFTLSAGGVSVSGTVSYNATTMTALFTPAAALSNSVSYTATVAASVKDVAGVVMGTAKTWSFTTIATTVVAPTVTSWSPSSPNDTNVSISTTVSATFSTAMDPSTITSSSFVVTGASGSVTGSIVYNSTAKTATFIPSTSLAYSSIYSVQLSTAIKDAIGTPLAAAKSWTFTTAAATVVPPTVTAVSPTSGATGVLVSSVVTATFSAFMDATTLTTASFSISGAAAVSGVVSYNSITKTATFSPSSPLAYAATYTATVTTSVKDSAGTALTSAYSWTFMTEIPVPPTITTVSPSSGTSGVSVGTAVTATFSASMDSATITTSSFTLTGATTVSGTVSYDAILKTATFAPSSSLGYSSTYTAKVTTAVKSSVGAAMSSAYTWTFTTEAPVPPTIVTVSPLGGASGVSVGTGVTAAFSASMDAATITTASFTLTGATAIGGTVVYNAVTKSATFTPSSPLAYSSTYAAKLTTTIKDSIGTALTSDFAWTFTTESYPASSGKVAVLWADPDYPSYVTDVTAKILASSGSLFAAIETININATTPTLADLAPYDSVLVYANVGAAGGVKDSVALGNVLADYVDVGRGVVLGAYVFLDTSWDPAWSLGGRFATGGYYPVTRAPNYSGSWSSTATMSVDNAAHPILTDVGGFGKGWWNTGMSPIANAQLVAHYTETSEPLLVTMAGPTGNGRVVAFNARPVSTSAAANAGWDAATDGGKIMSNCLAWAGGKTIPTFTAPSVGVVQRGKFLANPGVPGKYNYVYIDSSHFLKSVESTDGGVTWSAPYILESGTTGRVVDFAADMDYFGMSVVLWVSALNADPSGLNAFAAWSKKQFGGTAWEAQPGYTSIHFVQTGVGGIMMFPSSFRSGDGKDIILTVGLDQYGGAVGNDTSASGIHWNGATLTASYVTPPISTQTDNPIGQQVFAGDAGECVYLYVDNHPLVYPYTYVGRAFAIVGSTSSYSWASGDLSSESIVLEEPNTTDYPEQPYLVKAGTHYLLFYTEPSDRRVWFKGGEAVTGLYPQAANLINFSLKTYSQAVHQSRTLFAVAESATKVHVVFQDSYDYMRRLVLEWNGTSWQQSATSPMLITQTGAIDGISLSSEGGTTLLFVSAHDLSTAAAMTFKIKSP
ncbi:MAG TPA: Ig-like domain-containing protein [Rectinemataceae bacterium]|nr:Ig-like domain-containing protein [Rectinemataceae bacterium]